jgi:hypothetical protein
MNDVEKTFDSGLNNSFVEVVADPQDIKDVVKDVSGIKLVGFDIK